MCSMYCVGLYDSASQVDLGFGFGVRSTVGVGMYGRMNLWFLLFFTMMN